MTDGTDLISYEYNIDGQRISKTYDGVTTEYFYNGDILAGQKKGDDVIVFMYDNNGDIFGFEYNGTPYYYVKNAQNDVWLILDENGQAVVLYQYDAWGKVIGCLDGTEDNIASINPITYRSYYMDFDLGFFMYYLNSRYYMADWGRFVSADSYVQTGQGVLSNNMFAYCGNNPIARMDQNGDFWHIVAGAIIGGVASFVSSVVSDVITGNEIDWAGAAVSAGFGAVTGALIAACPAYAVPISATASAAESIVQDVRKENRNIGEIVVNATVSAGFGALTGSWGSNFANTNVVDDAVKAVPNLLSGNHPSVKKAAMKTIKSTIKFISNNYINEQFETLTYGALETGTQTVANLIIKSYYEEV